MRRLLSTFLVVGSLGGCDIAGVFACEDYAAAGILVAVVDSLSGGPVSAGEVTGVAAEGSYLETHTVTPAQAEAGVPGFALEREGVYYVQFTAPGYRMWSVNNVRVTADMCHVRTVRLTAKMQRP